MGEAPELLVVVDATNVARAESWGARHTGVDPATQLDLLVDASASWAAADGVEVVLVFDGTATTSRQSGGLCRVEHAGSRPADDLVERWAGEARAAGRRYWVVSGDGQVRRTAGAQAERVLQPQEFVALLRAQGGPGTGGASTATTAGASALGDLVSDEALRELEKIRRGGR